MPHWRRANKSRSWLVSVSIKGRRHLKTLPGDLSKREVAAWEREWRRGLEQPATATTHTVASVIERYWQEKGQYRARNRTMRAYLGRWGEALGLGTPAHQVQGQHVAAVVARWRKEPRAPARPPVVDASINRRLDALHAAWSYAAEVIGIPLPAIPWKRIRLAEPEPPDRSIGGAAVRLLLECWPVRSRLIAELLFATGMRLGAVLRLERKDIDLDRMIIHTRTKGRGGGKPIVAPMTTLAREILLRAEMPDVGRIWAVDERTFRRDREAARTAAGLPSWRAHDARHEFAQRLEDAGLGSHVSDALHHTSPAMRRRYAKARVDLTRDAIERAQMIHK